MQCKDMQTNRGSLCTHVHALQKELLKSHPWNLQRLSSIAELKVHVFKGAWNKSALCAVEEAPALCREIRAQDNREGLHERPNAESRAVWIISMLTVEMERGEKTGSGWSSLCYWELWCAASRGRALRWVTSCIDCWVFQGLNLKLILNRAT